MIRLASILRPFILLVVLLPVPTLADEIDIENAPTPTRLTQLLPEGGIEAVQLESWSVTEMTGPNGRVFTSDTYTHWSYKVVEGQLVMQISMGRAMPHSYLTQQRFTYTAEGELVAYHEVRESRGNRTADLIGKVEGDELVIKPNPEVGVLNENLSRERRIALKDFETHVPVVWAPLVHAYHIRSGHLGYSYATIDLTRSGEKISRSVEDLGTETIELQGDETDGHLLVENTTRERSGKKTTSSSQTMVLKNGSAIRSKSKNGRYAYLTKRVRFEDISEKFGLEQ
jgi:hypothetical protein